MNRKLPLIDAYHSVINVMTYCITFISTIGIPLLGAHFFLMAETATAIRTYILLFSPDDNSTLHKWSFF